MASSLRIVIADSDPALRAQLRRLLTECGPVEVVGECDAAAASRTLATLRPDVLVTEVSAATEADGDPGAQIERLARLFPSLAIVANGPAASADFVLRVIRAGAVEYVPRPLRRDDVAAALDKITRVRQGRPAGGPGRVTAVFSRKGGLGATTLAVNLAASLAADLGRKTVLLELSTGPSDVATALDLRPTYSVLHGLTSLDQMDESFLQGLLTRHASGLAVLPAPLRIEPTPLDGTSVRRLVEILALNFEEVVLDLPHALDGATVAALQAADPVLLLTTVTVAALRSTTAALRALRESDVPMDAVKPVIVRDTTGHTVTAKQVKETLGRPVFWSTPDDAATVLESLDTGRPVVLAAHRSRSARNFRELAEAIAGKGVTGAGAAASRGLTMVRLAWSHLAVKGG